MDRRSFRAITLKEEFRSRLSWSALDSRANPREVQLVAREVDSNSGASATGPLHQREHELLLPATRSVRTDRKGDRFSGDNPHTCH